MTARAKLPHVNPWLVLVLLFALLRRGDVLAVAEGETTPIVT